MLVAVAIGDGIERIDVPDEETLTLPKGVLGFEEYHQYVLLRLEGSLFLLQSLDDPEVAFVLLNPIELDPNYQPLVARSELKELGFGVGENITLLCVVTYADGTPVSANFRAPIAIDLSRRLGAQLVLQDSSYPVRRPICVGSDGMVACEDPGSRSGAQLATNTKGRRDSRGRSC